MALNTTIKLGGAPGKRRSETVSVRLDPRLRYFAELAARKQRRSLSSFIEWAIAESLGAVQVGEFKGQPIMLRDAKGLWDVEDADRFAKLALRYPEMLTHREQIIWKLVCENAHFWTARFNQAGNWAWTIDYEGLDWAKLRDQWETLQRIADGEADRSALPAWEPPSAPATDDDDIPF